MGLSDLIDVDYSSDQLKTYELHPKKRSDGDILVNTTFTITPSQEH